MGLFSHKNSWYTFISPGWYVRDIPYRNLVQMFIYPKSWHDVSKPHGKQMTGPDRPLPDCRVLRRGYLKVEWVFNPMFSPAELSLLLFITQSCYCLKSGVGRMPLQDKQWPELGDLHHQQKQFSLLPYQPLRSAATLSSVPLTQGLTMTETPHPLRHCGTEKGAWFTASGSPRLLPSRKHLTSSNFLHHITPAQARHVS